MPNSIPANIPVKASKTNMKYIMIAVVILVIIMCCSSLAAYMSSGSPAAPVSSGSPAAPVSSGSPAAPVSSGAPAAPVSSGAPVSGTSGPVAFAQVPAAAYITYLNTECYSSGADIGYQGKLTADQVKAACTANSSCAGAVQHSGGDWWLLSSVHANAGIGNSPNNQCIVAPGKTLI